MKNLILKVIVFSLLMVTLLGKDAQAGDTFESIAEGGKGPSTFDELWEGYDPQAEPLNVEVLKDWEEDGAVVKVVRYQAGTFKGQPAMVAAIYGYPKNATGKLPALVNVHGGGQYADARSVIANAKRGYATITVSWAGRLASSQYRVTPETVKLFWDGHRDDPRYLLTTDWGKVDGYHAPTRHPKSASAKVAPHELTLDEVDSPRNSLWFLATVASRRAITFLEQQPQVDPNRIGIYGHSMGAKITVLTAASEAANGRIKAAVPSCGGISNFQNDLPMYRDTLGDATNLSHVTCPLFFLSPANDFHGNLADLPAALKITSASATGMSIAPHHNHQDTAKYIIPGYKWLDHYLKGAPAVPATPATKLILKTESHVPRMEVQVNQSMPIISVDLYYTQQGVSSDDPSTQENIRTKYWRHVEATKQGESWVGDLPLYETDQPMWCYANVTYQLEEEDSATNYYYAPFRTSEMNVSSVPHQVSSEQLKESAVEATLLKPAVIEDFASGWHKEWFSYKPEKSWAVTSNKLSSPLYAAPAGAKLSFSFGATEANSMVVRLGDFAALANHRGGGRMQTFTFEPKDFVNASGRSLSDWKEVSQIELAPFVAVKLKFNDNGIVKTDRKSFGDKNWKGFEPNFGELKWE